MKRETSILAATVFILLAVAFLVMEKPGERSTASDSRGPFLTVDSASVDRIEITGRENAVVLEKQAGEWRLTRPIAFRADQPAVASLLHDLKTMNITGVVSSRPEKREMFRVDSTGAFVRLSAGGREVVALVVGKQADSPMERYARIATSDDVVLVKRTSYSEFDRPLREWRDRSLFAPRREQISRVTFHFGDTTFAMVFRDSAWVIDGKRVAPETADRFLTALTGLEADDFVEDMPAQAPRVSAWLSAAGVDLRFAFQKKTGKYFVQTSTSPQWYVVESWRANQVLLRKKEFVEVRR